MSSTGIWWLLLPWGSALAMVWALSAWLPTPKPDGRFPTIDGLRGHLATWVYIHHGTIWWTYLRTGAWASPQSSLFNHLGQSSVALFFMITAFLFVGRLMDVPQREVDWVRLYVSRLLRISPLYFLTLALMLVICLALSHGHLQTAWPPLLKVLGHWALFSVGSPYDINGVHDTFAITAGVTWSLPVEWMFYLSLPCLALGLHIKVARPLIVFSLVAALWLWHEHQEPILVWSFVAGGLSAWLVRRLPRDCLRGPLGSLLVLGCLGLDVMSNHDVRHFAPLMLASVAFMGIALGADLFGLLRTQLSMKLGELAYGIYLLHGVLLFVCFTFVFGREPAAQWSANAHGWLLTALAAVVVVVAWLAHVLVERPAMNHTDSWSRALRRLIGGRRQA